MLRRPPNSTTTPRHEAIQTPRVVSFFLNSRSGSRSNGNRIPALAVPEMVSLKTTVIW
jgi:hypothetical protein